MVLKTKTKRDGNSDGKSIDIGTTDDDDDRGHEENNTRRAEITRKGILQIVGPTLKSDTNTKT